MKKIIFKRIFFLAASLLMLSAAFLFASCGSTDASGTDKSGTDVSGTDVSGTDTTGTDKSDTDVLAPETSGETLPEENENAVVSENRLISAVRVENGLPKLYINDLLTAPVAYFGNTDIGTSVTEQAKMASDAGIHLHSVTCGINYNDDYSDESSYAYTRMTDCLDAIIEADSEAKIILRLNVAIYSDTEPSGLAAWISDDKMEYAGGSNDGIVSTASERWVKEADMRIRKIVDYIRSSEKYAPHVACMHITSGDCGEWFEFGFREHGSDISETNSIKFREWLKNKYKDDGTFREAWKVSYGIDEAKVPADLPNNVSADYPRTLILDPAEQRFVDYFDYIGELVTSRINHFAKTVKDASDNEMLVIVFYGYLFELSDSQSGHYNMQALLDSPYIDSFAGPASYEDRISIAPNGSVGATSAFMTVADSVVRHGKLWFTESDQRTFVNDSPEDSYYPNLKTLDDIYNVHRREAGAFMVHGTGMWAMDLMGMGWLLDTSIWENLNSLKDIYSDYLSGLTEEPRFDVVFIVDEKAESVAGKPSVSRNLLSNTRLEAYHAGVSFAFAEIDDVIAGKFNDAKLYIFLNPYRLDVNDTKKLSELLHKDGKTSLFMYGFGNLDESSVKELTGMDIVQSEAVSTYFTVTEDGNAAGFVKPSKLEVVNPSYYVSGGQSRDYAVYTENGKSSAAMYDGGEWKSLFIGGVILDSENIRAACGVAGVNVISDVNDVITANDSLIVYTASAEGEKTLEFGGVVDVYDCFDDKKYENVSSVTVQMYLGETRYFFITER